MTCNMPQSHPQSLRPPEQMSSGFTPARPSSSNMIQLPGQPLVASSEIPETQYQHNVIASSNEFLQNQMRIYPAPDLAHPRPLDFHHHTLQSAVPSHQQPAAIPVENAPVPRPDRWSEYSGGVGLSYHQPPCGQQQPPGSLDSGTHFVYPSLQRFPSILSGSGDLGPISDVVFPKSSIKPHYNPFASTFEQTDPSLNIDPAISPNAVGSASTKAIEHMNTVSPFGHSFPGSRIHAHESSAEAVPNVQKQFHSGFTSGAPYDPLLDSIEPSSSSINKVDLGKEKNRSADESRDASKLMNIEVDSENMNGLGVVAESEVEGLGEVAADTEAGVVENASPEFLGPKDWSSDIPGDIDNDQSLDKSKRSKDSRSMKLFKVAVADFVKEVLKPSWRQGNMSKEAFKTIVKKTVDKVSNSVPSSHIPKTPAKIKQYVQSSQRKVTKLVMGYVDKYAKL
uniref:SFR19-like C-terminal domain-containing protein n=1 Tax=Arundo donax TaxID=35708 RepID=A0A0A9D2S1_ARUDO